MEWQLDRADSTPLYRQVVRLVHRCIEHGELPPGSRLPTERDLARRLGVNRSTVIAAYQELAANGLVTARVGSGTVVSEAATALAGPDWQTYIAGGTLRPDPALEQEVLAVRRRTGVTSLNSGQASEDLFPIAAFTQLLHSAELREVSLGYGDVAGYTPLRSLIAARMGVSTEAVQILNGAQQGFHLIVAGLLDPGDTVAVEAPSYINQLSVVRSAPIRVLPLPVDEDGLNPAHLESLLARRRVQMVMVQPNYHNPTGTTMPLQRRKHILALCQKHRVPLLEDDAYHDLNLSGPALPTIKSLDSSGTVLYLGSFSKTTAPAMRLGWLAGPIPVLQRLAEAKLQLDQGTDTLSQWLIYRFLREGHYDAHVTSLRAELLRRRDALVAALAQLGDGVEFQVPAGGFHLWLRCRVAASSAQIFREAARQGLAIMPGAVYGEEPRELPGLRLTFAHLAPEEAAPAVAKLAQVLRSL